MKGKYSVMLVFAVFAVVFIWMGGPDTVNMSKDPINMNEVDWSTLKEGDHVNFTVDHSWTCLYSETTTETRYGIPTREYESGRGYVVSDLYQDAQGYYDMNYFIGLRLGNSNDYTTMDRIIEETYNWYDDTTGYVTYGVTTLYVDGTIEKMSKEEQDLMMDYLVNYCNYTTSEATAMVRPYMVTRGNLGASKTIFTIGLVAGGIFLIMLGITLWQYFQEKKELEGHTYMGISQAGSHDIYGGVNYGGGNFGGTNYGASNQYNKPYDGSVYGDTSYGGTNTYGSNTYGRSSTYGGTDTSGGTNTSGQDDTYNGPWQPYQ